MSVEIFIFFVPEFILTINIRKNWSKLAKNR